MARIRTIKPEFPQSESMGRVSRDARLLFILLWTVSDDEGRGRGASKLLSSLLYPYDDDAASLIDGWMDELEREGCIIRYEAGGTSLFQINKWKSHQKIDKPSPSRFPSPQGDITNRASERDIEALIFDAIRRDGAFAGYKVIDVQRQARVQSSYMDLFVSTEGGGFVLELKRDKLTKSDMQQVIRYAEMTGAKPALIGAGIGPSLSLDDCKNNDIAVIQYDDKGCLLLLPSISVKECSITFASASECQPLDQGPRTKDQGEEKKELAATATTDLALPESEARSANDDACPHEEIIAIYHQVLPELPAVKIWSDRRKRNLRARWKEDKERQKLEWWRWFFGEVRKSKFLMGQVAGSGGTAFVCTLDRLLQPDIFVRVIEGFYSRDRAQPQQAKPSHYEMPKLEDVF